ncbi:hemolysin family protein [Actinocorallia sp. B10E7]|uniref:hemolysin family protein n=1 Tax=Actinocorallia sp. B10E7 TaxID=3153558 RepID=UPI00325F681D
MSGYWGDIALVLLLILVNALFAGSEIALISLREGQLRKLEDEGGASRRLARLARDPNRFMATIQIGITLAGFLASATAAVSLAQPLVEPLGFLGGAARPAAVASVTVVLTFFTLVLGELAPKRLAMQYPRRWGLLVAAPLEWMATLSRPVVWALGRATDGVVRLCGGDPSLGEEPVSSEELKELVSGHEELTAEQRTVISSALDLRARILREVLVPRRLVFSLPHDMPVERARLDLAESGHSKAPVVMAGHVDDVVGVAYLRDLVMEDLDVPVGSRVRPAMVLPDVMRVTEALREFKDRSQAFALVMDENGSLAGIVTLDDLMEEVAGQFARGIDQDILDIRDEREGALLLPGTFPVHDLPDLNVDLGETRHSGYTTVAGLVLSRLGRLPERPGDHVEVAGWDFGVVEIERHAITSVRLRPARPEEPHEDHPEAPS